MSTAGNHYSGWLALDKPEGLSSAKALAIVRRHFSMCKAGHIGTLDPFATGLLPIALGQATKTIPFLTQTDKHYQFTLRFGAATDTGDLLGNIIQTSDHRPSHQDILEALPQFLGTIWQTPPRFSALKQNGQPSYKRARRGEHFTLPARQIKIYSLKILKWINDDLLVMAMHCEKGVYVRSFASDLAMQLGSCAHLVQLRRTQNGFFQQNHMISLDKIKKISHNGQQNNLQMLNRLLLPLEIVLGELPKISLASAEADQLRAGQYVQCQFNRIQPALQAQQNIILLAMAQGKIIALARWKENLLEPKRVFNP